MNTPVRTSAAPTPAYTFSQGVRSGELVQVSGQGPIDPATGAYMHPGDVDAQTELVLSHVLSIVTAGGGSFADLVMLRVYLTDRDHFAPMNAAYARFVDAHADALSALPARTTVICGLPHPDMLVEIDGLAVLGTGSDA